MCSALFQSGECALTNFIESYVSEFGKFPKEYFGNLSDTKLFDKLYLFRTGFDSGMRYTHTKEMPVSNQITFHNFVWNVVMKTSEYN